MLEPKKQAPDAPAVRSEIDHPEAADQLGILAGNAHRKLWALAGSAAFLAYGLTWFNRYLPVTHNGLFIMSQASRGVMPYRDYFWVGMPGFSLVYIFLQHVGGRHLIVELTLSLAFFGSGGFVLAYTLSQKRSAVVAGLAAAAAMILSCTDDPEYIGQYTHWTSVLAIYLCAGMYPYVVSRSGAWMPRPLHALLAGAAAGWMVMLKQTNLIVLALLALFLLALGIMEKERRADLMALVGVGTAAFALVVVPQLLWVAHLGAFRAFLDQTLLVGVKAKGSPGAVLTRFFTAPLYVPILQGAFVLAAAVIVLLSGLLFVRKRWDRGATGEAAAGAWVLAGIGLAIGIGYSWSVAPLGLFWTCIVRSSAYMGIVGAAIVIVLASRRYFHQRDDDTRHGLFLAYLSFAMVFAMSGSWGAMDCMNFPTLAIVISELFNQWQTSPGGTEARAASVAVILVCILASAWLKYDSPNRWAYWNEPPIAFSDHASRRPELAGFLVSEPTRDFYDRSSQIVDAVAGKDEPVLIFPHMLLLMGILDRPIFGFAPYLFFDVCPDESAFDVAKRLRAEPPPAIVYQDMSEATLKEQENVWRQGRPSGQRAVLDTIHELVARGTFEDVAVFADNGLPVRLAVRADRVSRLREPPSAAQPALQR